MNRVPEWLLLWAGRLHYRLGWRGLTGVALLLVGAPALLFLEQSRHTAERELTAFKQVGGASPSNPQAMTPRLSAAPLPAALEPASTLKRLNRAARVHDLVLQEASYRSVPRSKDSLEALEVQLTVRAAYLPIRRFLTDLAAENPGFALREFSAKRGTIDAAEVDASLVLRFYALDRKSGPTP